MYSFLHLTDDATIGGVSRVLEFMTTCPELQETSRHEIVSVRRGQFDVPAMADADAIVSNLAISWSNFPLLVALRAAHPNTPLIHIEHSYCERFVGLHVTNRDRFETLLRSAYSLFDYVIAVSAPQARWIARKGFVRSDRLHVIESLVSLEDFAAIPNRSRSVGDKFIVGAIGRMEPQKGFDILVAGFREAKLANCEMHLYGEGGQLAELQALARDRSNIVFKGFVHNPAPAMEACDVIAMPSRWEPYGLVAIEAMAAGRPVVCSRADGLSGHIAAGAIDVGENSARGWADRLEQLAGADLSLVAARGRRHALGAPSRFADGWNALIERAMNATSHESLAS
jgi:glycosyltransferase involved in cell wall biosynthesis